jgi:hypothetical protein
LGGGPVRPIVLVGGTVVDVSDFGHSTRDIPDAVVVIRDGRIAVVGPRGKVAIPRGATVVDVEGKYILPGLVDGFAGVNGQDQATAHLYMGVTTVVASQDDRRGRLFLKGNPSPHIYLMDGAGSNDGYDLLAESPEWAGKLKGKEGDAELSWEDSSRMMDEQARMGVKALWLGHNLTAGNTRRIIEKARRLGITTYGEFISTLYSEGIKDGVSVLLHMTRYELGLIPDEMQRPLIKDPEGSARGAYSWLEALSPADPRVATYARLIAENHVALMPTFSLQYAGLPGHRNLWKEPVAAILDPKRMFQMTDRETGELHFPSEEMRGKVEAMYGRMWELNRAFAREHPRYLAATGSPVFGSLPGISMHTELELLVRVGLTPREALAAATSNYAVQFGWRELGLVTPGRRADLLVVDADPTEDVRNSAKIHMVMLEGEVVDRARMLNGGK